MNLDEVKALGDMVVRLDHASKQIKDAKEEEQLAFSALRTRLGFKEYQTNRRLVLAEARKVISDYLINQNK